ncbi:uncharacterized protein LOC114242136 [Bombyx mandarina]|uniref:Uncharacterized protein LOC114242136 n=1 Tax=Bombyx mandarina TaxID=7092 RepID=A0A6J2JHE6_BOMMA|nr:uncharacterized protein LOC114242136 [Bombyx mandarina]
MKHQQVNVDYWAMGKAMLVYAAMTAVGWLILRTFNTFFMLPRRMRTQQENIQKTLQEMQRRFPDLNITEEDLKNAEKELDELIKDDGQKNKAESDSTEEMPAIEQTKKTI